MSIVDKNKVISRLILKIIHRGSSYKIADPERKINRQMDN